MLEELQAPRIVLGLENDRPFHQFGYVETVLLVQALTVLLEVVCSGPYLRLLGAIRRGTDVGPIGVRAVGTNLMHRLAMTFEVVIGRKPLTLSRTSWDVTSEGLGVA